MIAEGDRGAARHRWTATDPQSGAPLAFRGIVIWRPADRRIAERWARPEAPRPA